MRVKFDDGKLFYELYAELLSELNRKKKLIPGLFSSTKKYTSLPPKKRLKVRNALYDDLGSIDEFVAANPFHRSAEDLRIVSSWKLAVVGEFYIFRYLKNYTVFLSCTEPMKAYGVLALADPIDYLVGPYLPIWTDAVLLPLRGQIIYDGILEPYNIHFGSGYRSSINESYKEAKATWGIITSLDEAPSANITAKAKKPKKRKSGKAPGDVKIP
jgi:hypothetical protein